MSCKLYLSVSSSRLTDALSGLLVVLSSTTRQEGTVGAYRAVSATRYSYRLISRSLQASRTCSLLVPNHQ